MAGRLRNGANKALTLPIFDITAVADILDTVAFTVPTLVARCLLLDAGYWIVVSGDQMYRFNIRWNSNFPRIEHQETSIQARVSRIEDRLMIPRDFGETVLFECDIQRN